MILMMSHSLDDEDIVDDFENNSSESDDNSGLTGSSCNLFGPDTSFSEGKDVRVSATVGM